MIEVKISELRKFQKNLCKLSFSLTPIKEKKGQFRLRVGKKYIFIDCPSKDIGVNIKDAIMAVFKRTDENISTYIKHIEANAEQLSLQLFPASPEEEGEKGDGSE